MVFSYDTDSKWQDLKALKDQHLQQIASQSSSLVCKILYAPEYEEALAYFTVIMKLREFSRRALELTEHLISQCPAQYTAWHYRQLILAHLPDSDWSAELSDFLNQFTEGNKKNYQVWNHRQFVVENLPAADSDFGLREMDFVANILELDAKNYHAWSYRQWIIKRFQLWDPEIAYINQMLQQDIRNNSVWNQRRFVMCNGAFGEAVPENILESELEYVFEKIRCSPNNESSWLYMRGLFFKSKSKRVERYEKVIEFCNILYEEFEVKSPHLLLMLYDIHRSFSRPVEAMEMLKQLEVVDPIRSKYWQSLQSQVAVS